MDFAKSSKYFNLVLRLFYVSYYCPNSFKFIVNAMMKLRLTVFIVTFHVCNFDNNKTHKSKNWKPK